MSRPSRKLCQRLLIFSPSPKMLRLMAVLIASIPTDLQHPFYSTDDIFYFALKRKPESKKNDSDIPYEKPNVTIPAKFDDDFLAL